LIFTIDFLSHLSQFYSQSPALGTGAVAVIVV